MSNIQIVEYQSNRILTTQQLAGSYETDARRISENFNANKERYEAGKHYFCLEGQELKDFRDLYGNSVVVDRTPKLYLWTEKGALLHAKSLNTDKAWEVYDMLVETYFRVKSGGYIVGIDPSKLSPQMQTIALMVQQLAQTEIQAQEARQLALEAKEEIRDLTARIKTIPDEYYSIAGYASLRGLRVDISKAGLLGRKASKLSKEYDIEVGKVYDPRFGQVNTYHLDVLKEVFGGVEQETA